jgi:hypothetical protein
VKLEVQIVIQISVKNSGKERTVTFGVWGQSVRVIGAERQAMK